MNNKEHFNLYYIFLDDKNNNQMPNEKAKQLAKLLNFIKNPITNTRVKAIYLFIYCINHTPY